MSDFHGLDCQCCKDKSPDTQKIIDIANSILGTPPTNTEITLSNLSMLADSLKSSGGIDDIVSIAKSFFNTPIESLDLGTIELITDSNIGQFKLSELVDVQTQDISKVFNIQASDVKDLKSLKFSISIPTITAEKTLNFGANSITLKFLISREEFSYFPSPTITSRFDALASLQNSTYKEPITSSSNISIDEAKTLALSLYPTSKDVSDVVANSSDNDTLFNKLSSLGVGLYKTVNVLDTVNSIIANENVDFQLKQNELQDNECGTVPLTSSIFSAAELKEIEKLCCSADVVPAAPLPTADLSVIAQLQQIPDTASPDLTDIQNFISQVNSVADNIKDCSTQKQNATNSYYFFLEAKYLNEIALTYAQKRRDVIADLTKKNVQSTSFNTLAIPTFNETDIIGTFGPSQTGFISTQVSKIRLNFPVNNVITNQVGFTGDQIRLNILVDPSISNELNTLFQLNNTETSELTDYVHSISKRDKKFNVDVWSKFYSANRIDKLFTYQEQGYLTPKPRFDDNGNSLSSNSTLNITNALGDNIKQSVAKDALNSKIDSDTAINFWQNIEVNTLNKVTILLNEVETSSQFVTFMNNLLAAAEAEAKISYAASYIAQQSGVVNGTSLSIPNYSNLYDLCYESLNSFQNSIIDKLTALDTFIQSKNQCIADNEQTLTNICQKLTSANNPSPENNCQELLGSDPFGLKPSSDCPGVPKNCYWEEYTKIMQLVSFMPIPDIEFLTKRLFRYYPRSYICGACS